MLITISQSLSTYTERSQEVGEEVKEILTFTNKGERVGQGNAIHYLLTNNKFRGGKPDGSS